ncbi:MAG: undecaprenyl-diphosphate phosphatase [Patescibacteria group bacterium]|jgi:undecaprenyl-diphosphatase
MDYLYSIILGATQALTEFLPISSSGHLVILHRLIKSDLLDSLTFDVILHAGTLIATLFYFRRTVGQLIGNFFKTIFSFKITHNFNEQLPWLLIIGAIPAALVGFFYGDLIEATFRSIGWIAITLTIGSLLFIVYEKTSKQNRHMDTMNFFDALVIGTAQILAFVPGISRSGITIVAGLGLGFKRKEAADFSFLLSLPIVFGATLQKITQISWSDLNSNFIFVSLLGLVVSSLLGFVVIKYFIRFLASNSLTVFAIYRFILAGALLVFLY